MLLDTLAPQPADPLLGLIGQFRADPRVDKLDLGVGVYFDAHGDTPVFKAVKLAERRLWERQETKRYLGPEGDREFTAAVSRLLLDGAGVDGRWIALQTPGGTGAVRLGLETLKLVGVGRVLLGLPSWPVHANILDALGLETVSYRHYDPATGGVDIAALMERVESAGRGETLLVHGCCHNPSGADLTEAQWITLADALERRGVVPLIDLAYHGLGEGLAEDLVGVRAVLARVPEAMVAYSCDKNFGLYRERTGALFTIADSAASANRVEGHQHAIARAVWSMPPDHGAAVVRGILTDDALEPIWRMELDMMRERIRSVRDSLAAADTPIATAAIGRQNGLFSLLPLSPTRVARLRESHGVYMANSGRINVAGLTEANLPHFVDALRSLEPVPA